MLDLDDIQHFLLTRPHALAARYEFLSFASPEAGRAWLAGILDTVGNARAVTERRLDTRWVSRGIHLNGLRALGVDESSLATFPEEFREGMAARAEVCWGDVGNNHPDHWDDGPRQSGSRCHRHSVCGRCSSS
jgi:hypothetical protein